MDNNISKETLKILISMQQNEVTEHAVYLNLAKFVKKEDDKNILIKIAREEYAHAKVLEKSKFEAIKKANPNIKVEHLEDWNDDQDLLNQLLNL